MLFVDTDILIDAGRGAEEAVGFLQNTQQNVTLAVSAVTQMELLVGARNKSELREIERFLAQFYVVKLSEAITDKALALLRTYRLSHGLLIPDALIAATAITMNEPLASKNQRDYRFITELKQHRYP
jgi:predicted nucleic acid-binding protein